MGLSEVREHIKQKALSLDDLKRFMAKIAETDMSDEEFERINYRKSYVPIWQIEILLDGYVCVEKEKLRKCLHTYEIVQKSGEPVSEVVKILKEILNGSWKKW